MGILGTPVLRAEDARFLLGRGRYVENLPLEGALTVTFVRSLLAHARIAGVDTSAAEAREPSPVGGGDPPRPRGEPLPLHRIRQHRPRGAGRRGGAPVIPVAFEYRRAGLAGEAVELLGGARDAKLLAGGRSLTPAAS